MPLRHLFVVTCLLFATLAGAAPQTPKPLYRDPVFDGAADVSIIYDRAGQHWAMFYTSRRATLPGADPKDVSWVHGTQIGMATSNDGKRWDYAGAAAFPAECTGATLWAPELAYENGSYHMWLTVVPGIFKQWGAAGATARIVHLTSPDLSRWNCADTLALGSERVIDASVIKLASGGYRLWYKDERAGSRIFAVDSTDLKNWTRVVDQPVVDTNAEGPKVFFFKGYYWMIADKWKGLIVLRSTDAAHWTLQPRRLLEQPGSAPTDNAKGQHPDIVVNHGRALIYYFVHQENAPEAASDPLWHRRSAIQVAELKFSDGQLTVDRDAPLDATLKRP